MTKQNIPFQIGHVLIKVHNLKEAVKDYEALGFRVTYGSDPKKATNAMIYFPDGSFLELFSTDFGPPIDSLIRLMVALMLAFKNPYAGRYRNYILQGEGFRDYALDSTKEHNFQSNMEMLQKEGITVHGPRHMKRKNPDGISLNWSLCYPPQERLPFFMSPYHPNIVLPPSKTEHPNGAAGFKELVVSTRSWEKDFEYYRKMFRQTPPLEREGSVRLCRFQLEGTSVVLEEGHMDGVQRVLLKVKTSAVNGLNQNLCHGAELMLESEEQLVERGQKEHN